MEQGQPSTIAHAIACEGIGLHSGTDVRLRLEPSESGGRSFVDPHGRRIPASIEHVRSSARATVLEREGAKIATVEHLLAVLSALGIDHVRIQVEGPEVPAFDGSALPIVEWVASAGRRSVAGTRRVIELRESIEIREGERFIRAEPADELRIDYAIDFDHPLIRRQRVVLDHLDAKTFERELAPARTFGFLHEVEALRAEGLGLGGDLDNALILDDDRLLGDSALRFPDEFVRHKAMDLVGDLALLGAPLRARVRVERGGHRLHHRLASAILEATRRA